MDPRRGGISLVVFNLISQMTSERERVRYQVEHEKGYSISTSSHVLFCLLYRTY